MPDPEGLRPATWDDIISHEAKQAKVPPQLALAVANVESGMKPDATSPKGARGFFQLMPETAKVLGFNPDDPVENIRGGVKYLRQLLDQHGGDVSKALTSYNWGPGNVAKGGTPPPETTDYVSRVLSKLAPEQASTPQQVAPITLKEANLNIGQPPPATGGPVKPRTVAKPPPKSMLATVTEGFDPRSRTGRRNLDGMTGDIVGTGLGALTSPVTGLAGPAVGGALGAGGMGAVSEAGERFAGTA